MRVYLDFIRSRRTNGTLKKKIYNMNLKNLQLYAFTAISSIYKTSASKSGMQFSSSDPLFSESSLVAINPKQEKLIERCLITLSTTNSEASFNASVVAQSENDAASMNKYQLWASLYQDFVQDFLVTDQVPSATLEKLAVNLFSENAESQSWYTGSCRELANSNFMKPYADQASVRGGSLWAMVFSLHPIADYACWCHFGKKAGQGSGQAQNMVDGICQDLQLCYRCIKHDDPNCAPWDTDYLVQMTHSSLTDTSQNAIVSMCTVNTDSCPFNVCACEMKMLTEFWNRVTMTNYQVDYAYKHNQGFDYDGICRYHMLANTEKICCGKYPDRRPYGINYQDKECCNDLTIFNPVASVCCDDGSVAEIGTGCEL